MTIPIYRKNMFQINQLGSLYFNQLLWEDEIKIVEKNVERKSELYNQRYRAHIGLWATSPSQKSETKLVWDDFPQHYLWDDASYDLPSCLPSGKPTKNYWIHGHRNSWFTH